MENKDHWVATDLGFQITTFLEHGEIHTLGYVWDLFFKRKREEVNIYEVWILYAGPHSPSFQSNGYTMLLGMTMQSGRQKGRKIYISNLPARYHFI